MDLRFMGNPLYESGMVKLKSHTISGAAQSCWLSLHP